MSLPRVILVWVCLVGLLLSHTYAGEAYEVFRSDMHEGDTYRADARQLHPTQFALGMREVVAKAVKFDRMTDEETVAYLKKKDVPIVIGPGGVPYLTDGHHTMRGLLESRRADKTTYGHVLANWSDLTAPEFWRRMQGNRWVFLMDGDGKGPLAPESLPDSLTKMQSDPYRGLAWAMKEAGMFAERRDVFYQEFYWAQFLRDKVKWNDADEADFKRALTEAGKLAASAAAADLPGARPAH